MIEKGKHVKCFLRNGMMLEGIIEEDTITQRVLKGLDGESLIIIHHPAEDIMLSKVMLTGSSENSVKKIRTQEPSEHEQKVKEKLKTALQPTGDVELDKMNIDQLRDLVVQQDRLMLEQKKREHFGRPGAAKRAVPYSNPHSAYQPITLPNTPIALKPRQKGRSAYAPGKIPRKYY